MKKKNGYTIVELIISMVLIITVMLFIIRTIIVLTNKNNDLLVYEEYTVFTNTLLKNIYKDLEISYESDNFIGLENNTSVSEVKFKDINKILKIDKDNRKIIYDGVIYELPDKVEFRNENGMVYKVSDLKQSTHKYYVVTIFTKINNRNDEVIQIVYQNKNDVDLQIEYDPNGGTITSGNSIQIAKYGDRLKIPTVSYGNNIFLGWYDRQIGGNKIDSYAIIYASNKYYAHWNYNYEITYNLNGGFVGEKCANENGTCSFSGTKQVCFGAVDSYLCGNYTNSVVCSNSVFTDPIIGESKACYLSPNPINYYETTSSITLSNPSRTGYTFKGWTGSNGTKAQLNVTIPTGSQNNREYIANYTANKYTVLLNNNNSTTAGSSSTTATYNSNKLAKISKPQKVVTITYVNNVGATIGGTYDTSKTYTLTGWYTQITGGSKVANNSTTPALQANVSGYTNASNLWRKTSEATLYAQWKSVTATLPTVTKEGNTCIWTTDNGSSKVQSGGTWTFTAANERTFTASCSPGSHILSYDSDGGTSCSSKTGTYGSNWGTLCSPTKTGYDFGGWYTSKNGGGTNITKDTTVSSSLTVYAKWIPKTYTVNYNYPDVTGCTSSSGKTYWSNTATYNSNYYIEPNWWSCPGYTFNYWWGSDNKWWTPGDTWKWTYTQYPDGVTLTAQWSTDSYVVHYVYPDVTGCTSSYDSTWDDTVYYNTDYYIQPNWYSCPGYTFDGWWGSDNQWWTPGSTWKWTYTNGVTLTARWKKDNDCTTTCSNQSYSCTKSNFLGTMSNGECYKKNSQASWIPNNPASYGGLGKCIYYYTGTCSREVCSCN